jgi:hypothetical protein
MQRQEFDTLSPYGNFVYALKAKETKRQYPHRLDKFLSFLGIEGTIEQKCNKLYEIGKDVNQFQSRIINFINIQKDRIASNEISEGTLCNYIKAIKLFCSMNDIIVNWKKISKGMPAERHNADDRIPTSDEIHRPIGFRYSTFPGPSKYSNRAHSLILLPLIHRKYKGIAC